ncbi:MULTISPECIES: Na+/H+ antiporter NhaC [unclassified Lentimicrobium]|uniref:Na+/H+ antiporter NhaC n=1 Tax=unclassified Lentimicrobium TaxID=2677434 RepID=UPI0015535BC0|nr:MULTISPECIES: Na+/H+ antiporter NhaC [unclassified Lentimicrobium]NPD45132.1 Na+/H+ antiporter NhaC [Lentimicrobium sp. S6]NPD86546.1 Na+/H+ antiporter NhaC [Lentimicrobium sp. L6]
MQKKTKVDPSYLDALIPVIFLIGLLSLAVYIFADDASWGPNQIALTFSSLVAAVIGLKNGHTWDDISNGVVKSISQAMGAIFILLAVGALIGTWVMSGTVTTMIYYGLKLLNPDIFYPSVVIVCAIIAGSIGSSWTTVGTIGVGMIGIAHGMDMSVNVTAGAIISGSYFGDKLSPLSDTTNLAPAVAGSDLYKHIKHMLWTTIPSITIALILFTVIGLFSGGEGNMLMKDKSLAIIEANFTTNIWLLTPILVVLVLAIVKMRPFPTILLGALAGGIIAVIFQTEQVIQFVDRTDLSQPMVMIAGVWKAMYTGFTTTTGAATFDELVNRGGMNSMLDVIWLILSALMFGGVMEETGMLRKLVQALLKMVHGTGSLIATTIFTCMGVNIIASDQYMSIVLPGRMFKMEYERRDLAPENLSRTLEDSGTLTSALIPWNTCGAYMSGTLGVATFAYLPFAFFNLINPLIAIILAYSGISIKKNDQKEKQ